MTELTIHLDNDLYRLLSDLAESCGLTVDQLVKQVLTDIALNPKTKTEILARQIVEDNRELYERLAG